MGIDPADAIYGIATGASELGIPYLSAGAKGLASGIEASGLVDDDEVVKVTDPVVYSRAPQADQTGFNMRRVFALAPGASMLKRTVVLFGYPTKLPFWGFLGMLAATQHPTVKRWLKKNVPFLKTAKDRRTATLILLAFAAVKAFGVDRKLGMSGNGLSII